LFWFDLPFLEISGSASRPLISLALHICNYKKTITQCQTISVNNRMSYVMKLFKLFPKVFTCIIESGNGKNGMPINTYFVRIIKYINLNNHGDIH
jgi:hypothetical protein